MWLQNISPSVHLKQSRIWKNLKKKIDKKETQEEKKIQQQQKTYVFISEYKRCEGRIQPCNLHCCHFKILNENLSFFHVFDVSKSNLRLASVYQCEVPRGCCKTSPCTVNPHYNDNMCSKICCRSNEFVDWLQSFLHCFCHSLSLPVAVFVSSILFHCFTIFSTKGHNLSNHYKLC